MRYSYLKRVLFCVPLILFWQAVMIAAILHFDSSPQRWIPACFAISALLLPFVSYIAVLYDAPLLMKFSRYLKAGVLTVVAFVATFVIYAALFIAELIITGQM
jgi:hypothetical protein